MDHEIDEIARQIAELKQKLSAARRRGAAGDYCAPWRLFDLLAGGVGAWEPRYSYDRVAEPA